MASVPTFWLSMHVPYRCGHSGRCCSSGWPIAIERDRADAVGREITAGRVQPLLTPWILPAAGAPADVAGTLAIVPSSVDPAGSRSGGACVFHHQPPTAGSGPARRSRPGDSAGESGCAIYTGRPSACEHFPYVCTIDPRGVHVTLSHYCPTAAHLLVTWTGPVEIVEGPPIFADGRLPEGLDARDALPPASPAVSGRPRLMDWSEVTSWERGHVDALLSEPLRCPDVLARFSAARAAVPAPLDWPQAPDDWDHVSQRLVDPVWAGFAPVVGRYLAARGFASWALHLGHGVADVVRSVDTAHAVLRVEAARRCADAGRMLDTALLTAAIRQSDLLLVHYADPERLVSAARRLGP